MPLSQNRVLVQGMTPHPHEQQAIEFIKKALPDSEPYRLWALVTLADPSGRRYEIDALILGYHALYLVEIKSHPATVSGSVVDWVFEFAGGGRSVKENPLRLADQKARVLASLLERRMPGERPWVEPLIFLSHPDVRLAFPEAARTNVVTQGTFAEAITHARFPGVDARMASRRINKPLAQATAKALLELGLAPSAGAMKLGELLIGSIIEEGPGYQDREATHERMPHLRRRVRTYLVPQSETRERSEQLRRAAEREASLLTTLGDHPRMMKVTNYHSEGPMGGPCVVFEHLPDALPLDTFLRQNPNLPFEERVDLLEQLGEALDYCHRKKVLHRGLHPGSVLVQRREGGGLDVRLYNFQLALKEDGTPGTRHLSAFQGDPAALYRAPELIEDPSKASTASDVFSLGAIAYHVLTGRSPGSTLQERDALMRPGFLSVAAARDDLAAGSKGLDPEKKEQAKSLDEVVQFATDVNPVQRADSAMEWVNLLLEQVTTPAAPEVTGADPLVARRGDRLGPDLGVEDVLGTGSTARVLRVLRDGTRYALKVPLSPEYESRLRAEADVLERLRGERIVALVERLKLSGRTCLLLTDAGKTLGQLLAEEGPVSLDYAARWGEDLLLALQALEEKGVQHRDIKPSNVGVLEGASKKARHLMLFDFSLSTVAPTEVTAGTPVYRDPFLVRRGRWDEAADRWSAALTLHEMLTGVRPRFPSADMAAVASTEEITLSAERFDASVRTRLLAFFRKALARDVASRHESAEAMRKEWMACFAHSAVEAPSAEPGRTLEDALAGVTPDSSVEALPLSFKARNALDRSGVVTVRELLLVPQNHLSAMRGVGRTTTKEILNLLDQLRERLGPVAGEGSAEPVFFPGYRGADGDVAFVPRLPEAAAVALDDAGLGRLAQVASAARARVARLLAPHPRAEETLLAYLKSASKEGASAEAPSTVEAWLEALLPKKPKSREVFPKHVRMLFGLEAPEQRVPDVRTLAVRLGITPQGVYLSLSKARERWAAHPALAELHERVGAALEQLGGAAPVARVAEVLPTFLPHDAGASEGSTRRAQALVRLVAESGRGLVPGRLHEEPWIGMSPGHLDAARALGNKADALAAREPLPSSEEVREALSAVVEGTPLARVAPERLVSLAAEASRSAARSARLELYPRGMPVDRALALSAGALVNGMPAEAIVKVVAARYPEAEPLPPRPALDAVVEKLGLTWSEAQGVYVRAGATAMPTTSTQVLDDRRPTTHSSHRPKNDPEAQEAQEFNERLRLAAERGSFRVVEVSSPYADAAAEELGRRLKVRPRSLEQELLEGALKLAEEFGAELEVVYAADREGPGGPHWPNLRQLMLESAERLGQSLREEKGKRLVLTHPGMLARYHLESFLRGLWEASQRDDGPAVFLVVPAHSQTERASIHGVTESLPIPTTSAAQRMQVPETWILNLDRGGKA
ncbi:BREX system serine/threonine kinase PglW [Myxococcus vastator]|uniref:BREX system serine/threonine kinase PglW n=1 Tax=Myxococcus vastator TaxID=2709664 RepID=UPI0013D2556D|nr:BREX system serine/threonine kinase PglW [Myxococcus vastator]